MNAPSIDHFAVFCCGALPARVQIPGGRHLLIRRGGIDPILGPVDAIWTAAGELVSEVARVDWTQPSHIPAVRAPGRLASGAGTAILNMLARAADGPLRYRGPYPSLSLFDSLLTCFRVEDAESARDRFGSGAEVAAVSGAAVEPDVDFHPDPFSRFQRGDLCIQRRGEQIESIFVGCRGFHRAAPTGRRLIERAGGIAAVLDVGGRIVAEVVELEASGEPRGRIARLPRLLDPSLGRSIPGAVARAIWELLEARAPILLRPGLAAVAADTAIVWGDPRLALASTADGTICVHLGFARAALSPDALLASLAAAIEPVAARLAQRRLEAVVT